MNASITLSRDDLRFLSPAARQEVLGLLSAEPVGTTRQPVQPQPPSAWVSDIDPQKMAQFMEGCSDLTKRFLRVFAENNGRASMKQLVEAVEYTDWHQLAGIQAGITRRIRKILGQSDAYILEWDWSSGVYTEDDKLIAGEWSVSDGVYKSLRAYFRLD